MPDTMDGPPLVGSGSTFARNMHRLSEVETRIVALTGDLARTSEMERQAKASAYLSYDERMSHGERQARASHENVHLTNETSRIKAELEQLCEERDHLKFVIDRVE